MRGEASDSHGLGRGVPLIYEFVDLKISHKLRILGLSELDTIVSQACPD